MSIPARRFLFEGRLERRQHDLFAGARERGRSGSRWSARSDARTNDLEAAALATQNGSGCQWRLASGSTIRVLAWEREGSSSRLGCSGMSSPRLIGMVVFGHDRAGSIT